MTDEKACPVREEITTEIVRLKAMVPKIRRYTAFGDDNRKAIQADITVLEKEMSENEIFAHWEDDEYTLNSAQGALEWLGGDESARPSDNWAPLV